jgi:hypothetical protein
MSGSIGKLSGIKILISDYIENDCIIVSPDTYEKMKEWFEQGK